MTDRVNVRLGPLELFNAEDGSVMAEFGAVAFYDLKYADAVAIEGLMLGALAEMHKWGIEKAKGGQGPGSNL